MLDAITKEVAPKNRALAERSISATAGALFGIVVASALGLLAGRLPFTLDVAMLTLYASVIPLSIAGFMVRFTSKPPRLPILATLYFTAFFVASVFFAEALLGTGSISIAGATLALKKLVGFRVMGAAAFAGLLFRAVPDARLMARAETSGTTATRVDWEARHQEAIRRLAVVDVDIRQRKSTESMALSEFDRRLRAATEGDDIVLDIAADDAESVIVDEVLLETEAAA